MDACPSKKKPKSQQQLEFLAFFAALLEDVAAKEQAPKRDGETASSGASSGAHAFGEQTVVLPLGQGGCGKAWLVHNFLALATAYVFKSADAVRGVAFSNAQAANLSSAQFLAVTPQPF